MIVNNLDSSYQTDFKLGNNTFDENIVSINKKISSNYNLFNYAFSSKSIRVLEIIFNNKKEHNERYEVKELNDIILCKIIKYHKFRGYDADISNKKILKLNNNINSYKSIIFEKVHTLEQ